MEYDQYIITAAAFALFLIILSIIYYIFRKRKTFSFIFPVRLNDGKSTLPGIGDNTVSDDKCTNVELKKKTTKSLNVTSLENESGLV